MTEERFLYEHFSKLTVRQLNEKYGLFNGCEMLAKRITKRVLEENVELGKIKKITMQLNNSWINKVNIILLNDNLTKIGASYVATSSKIIKIAQINDYKYYPLCLEANLNNNNEKRLIVKLMHELTHAYEDYNRFVNNKESLANVARRIGYTNNQLGTYNGLKQMISFLLYYITDFERNAYVAQMQGELNIQNIRFTSIDKIIEFLKNTEVYKNYQKIMDYVDGIITLQNDDIKKQIMKYAEELSEYHFNTFNQFCSFLINKKNKIERKFNTNIPKNAYNTLNFGGLITNSDEEIDDDLEIYLK